MGMEYKSAVKIMDDVIKGYLKENAAFDAGYTVVFADGSQECCHTNQITGVYKWNADQIAEAYSRIRNG